MAYSSLKLVLALGSVRWDFLVDGACGGRRKLYSADGLEIRWDNTLRYSAALRLDSPSAELLSLREWRRWRPQLLHLDWCRNRF